MEFDPHKLYVVHYDSTILLLTDSKEDADARLKKEQDGPYKALEYKITLLSDFGFDMWSRGKEEQQEDDAEY